MPRALFLHLNNTGCTSAKHSNKFDALLSVCAVFETSSRAHLLTLFSVAMPALLLQPRWRICIPIEHFKCKNNSDHLLVAAKHDLRIQQSYAPERWSCSLRVRGPHFASKVSYNAGAATDDCASLCKSPLRGCYR